MNEYVIKTPRQLGPLLQGFRKERHLTQAQVGKAVGVPQSVVSKLELDPSFTALGRVFQLVAALDLELVLRPRDNKAQATEW